MWEPLKNDAVLTVELIVFGETFIADDDDEDWSDKELREEDEWLLVDRGES